MYQYWNPNPAAAKVGDCTVRAISKATKQTWEETYIQLALYGLMLSDMPSANAVWGAYLKDNGFSRYIIPDEYMTCTVSEFANNHPEGAYILALSGHVIAVIDGNYYDTWDSGAMTPISIALAIAGEPLNSATAIVTPAAVGEYFNVFTAAFIDVPRGCCITIAVENTSTQAINIANSNLIAERVA